MKKTLRERYEERKHDELLAEGFLDYFKQGSENIQTFNKTISQLKNLASKYQLPTLQKALANAEQQFTQVVMAQQAGQKPDASKSQMISKATALVSGMSNFMNTLKTVTTQLPSMRDAIQNANGPNGDKPLSELLGADAQQFTQLITTQLQKAGGGFLSKIKAFFTGSGTQTPAQVMAEFGLPPETLAQELMKLSPKQLAAFSNESASVRPFTLSGPPPAAQGNTGTKPAEQTVQAAQTQQTVGTQPSAETAPATSSQRTGANTRPTPAQAQERDVAIQRAVPQTARNAFNTQQLGALSNEEVTQSLQAIARALGAKL